MAGFIPGLVVLGFVRNQTEHSRKQHSFMASASAPASRFLHYKISVLTSFSDQQWYRSVSQINLFLPNLFFGHCISLQQ